MKIEWKFPQHPLGCRWRSITECNRDEFDNSIDHTVVVLIQFPNDLLNPVNGRVIAVLADDQRPHFAVVGETLLSPRKKVCLQYDEFENNQHKRCPRAQSKVD